MTLPPLPDVRDCLFCGKSVRVKEEGNCPGCGMPLVPDLCDGITATVLGP